MDEPDSEKSQAEPQDIAVERPQDIAKEPVETKGNVH